jgi:hypothetical protein
LSAIAAPPPGGAARPEPPTRKLITGLIVGGLLVGALGGYLSSTGSFTQVFALGAVLVPLFLWRQPYIAPAVLLAAGILVEQGSAIPRIPITESIPLYQGIGPGHLEGADILIVMLLFIYRVKGKDWGASFIPRSHVSVAVRAILVSVVLAIVIGHVHHGSLRVALMQARPWVYLAATYFLASAFIRDRRAIRAVLWTIVGAVGFKAVQGILVWMTNKNLQPKPQSYISHEASYFFEIFLMLVAALWLFEQKGRLRTWATRLLPVVVFAILVNDRRLAWEMIGGGFLCFGIIAYKAMPIRRRMLGKAVVGLILLSAVYFPVMWNSTSSVALPVRAIKSQVSPSFRDASSDVYRVQENDNLELGIRQGFPFGKGFGLKIDYALPITDISPIDPAIIYIPHDEVLYVLMNMGLLGGVAVWSLIGAGIILGARLATVQDHELAVVGIVVACALIAYALIGAEDVGFFWYRVAFITGTLLGTAEAALRVSREQPVVSSPIGWATRRWRWRASSHVTRGHLRLTRPSHGNSHPSARRRGWSA